MEKGKIAFKPTEREKKAVEYKQNMEKSYLENIRI